MVNVFYFVLLAVSVVGVVVSLFNATKAIKSYGAGVLIETACYVVSSVLLALGVWLPFWHHTLSKSGLDGDFVMIALAVLFTPSVLLQMRKPRNS